MPHFTVKIKGKNFARPFVISFNDRVEDERWTIVRPAKRGWPLRHTQLDIERMLSEISQRDWKKEYLNTPATDGKVFRDIPYTKSPSSDNQHDNIIVSDDVVRA